MVSLYAGITDYDWFRFLSALTGGFIAASGLPAYSRRQLFAKAAIAASRVSA